MNVNFHLEIYVDRSGRAPFVAWLESLDASIRHRVKERLDRVSLGNLGDFKSLGKSLYEMRLDFGAGYRIYFSKENDRVVLLFCAGNKSTQAKDIDKARRYYDDYNVRKK